MTRLCSLKGKKSPNYEFMSLHQEKLSNEKMGKILRLAHYILGNIMLPFIHLMHIAEKHQCLRFMDQSIVIIITTLSRILSCLRIV